MNGQFKKNAKKEFVCSNQKLEVICEQFWRTETKMTKYTEFFYMQNIFVINN